MELDRSDQRGVDSKVNKQLAQLLQYEAWEREEEADRLQAARKSGKPVSANKGFTTR